MIRAAIVGMGWWGKTLVESVQGTSDIIQFIGGTARNISPELKAFGELHQLRLAQSLDELLKDPAIDAIVLATPHSVRISRTIHCFPGTSQR